MAQMKVEFLILVPDIFDGIRTTIGALWYLVESEDVSFHPFHSRMIDACA